MVFGICRRKKEQPKTLADTFGEMLEEIDKGVLKPNWLSAALIV